MLNYLEELSVSEAANIKKTIQDLFRQTCILQIKVDPVTLIQKDNPRYRTCLNYREFISSYLAVLDCELVHDPQEQLFRIKGESMPTEKMNHVTTRIMLILKLIYRDKIMGDGLNATVTTLREIRETGASTNLITRKLNNAEWQDALVLFKVHQIIDIPCAVGNLDDDTPIYIYGTINIFCTSVDINELVEQYKQESKNDENVEIEENTSETVKEDIYEDVSE